MAKKFYAVKVGLIPGIYENWADCQAQINGYSGAVFKGFATREEAEQFLGGEESRKMPEPDGEVQQLTLPIWDETEAVAYVDGSYDVATGNFSYGMVIFHDGVEEHFSKKYENSQLASMRNVAGEIEGARAAMQYCLDHKLKSVTIYHDYMGIAAWCTGDWKAKQEGTMDYARFYQKAVEQLEIRFQKVKGHSGDKYNELADTLAKEALGI